MTIGQSEAAAADEVRPEGGKITMCTVDGRAMARVDVDGRSVLISARCPHRGASMLEGRVVGKFVVCGRHGATFDMRTGNWVRGPACKGIKVEPTQLET